MSNVLPSAFIKSLSERFQLEKTVFFNMLEKSEQVTSIRLNPFKPIQKYNTEQFIPWCEYGRYLKQRPAFISDPLFHAGCLYVQEASSMFLEQVLKHTIDFTENIRVLDLCAAPGGKSTLIASLLSPDSLLVSNEIIKTRVPALSDNLTRWGVLNSVVSNNDPADFSRIPSFFDVLVVDAPCSGSGMFRKDPETINQWSERVVQLCSQRQKRVLADSYDTLKNNGILIYSTCSYSIEENENIADWLCDHFDLTTVRIPIDSSWGIIETISDKHKCYGYRFYPHRVKGEGFFITCFKKNDGNIKVNPSHFKPEKIPMDIFNTVKTWLTPETEITSIPTKHGYSIINQHHYADVRLLQSKLYLKKAGTLAGKLAGRDLIPAQELAQSIILGKDIQRVELSLEEALLYLRKDDLQLNSTIKGWTLMCFEGFGLGWAKILPNRVNNYYPKEIRILKEL